MEQLFSPDSLVPEIVYAVLGTVAVAVLAFFGRWALTQVSRFFATTRLMSTLRNAGLAYFIPSRRHYHFMKGRETIAAYISKAQRSLIYVGFWHAKGIEIENMKTALTALTQNGVMVELVFLNPEIDAIKAKIVSDYLGITESSLRSRLQEAIKSFQDIKDQLNQRSKAQLVIRLHDEAVYSSCFIVDRGDKGAKTLVDIKIFGAGRQNSFAMELVPTKEENSLYDRFTDSFAALRERARIIY